MPNPCVLHYTTFGYFWNVVTYVHTSIEQEMRGSLKMRTSIPRQDWVMFLRRCLEEKECKNPSGNGYSRITLHYIALHYIALRYTTLLHYITLRDVTLHYITLH